MFSVGRLKIKNGVQKPFIKRGEFRKTLRVGSKNENYGTIFSINW